MQKNNFVNILDTVNEVAGDQLYANLNYFDSKKIESFKRARRNKARKEKIKSFFGLK
ncbi:MAG: hypothetical protein IPH32_08055 [Bacteroidetes bacterium]|nr:hypothetical protein [Bacteroidota bacterium]